MARLFLTAINLNQNELQNARLQNLAAAPTSPAPVAGQVYYDTTQATAFQYNGTAWVALDAAKNSSVLTTYHLNQWAAPTASIGMAGFTFTGLGTPNAAGQAATYDWTLARSLSSFTGAVTANIPMSGFKLTGLGAPTAAGDSAEYSWTLTQIQNSAAGIASKPPVMTVYTGNVATLSGLIANDGYTPVAGDRVLLVGQATASQNGVYNVSAGAWTRTTVDGSGNGEIEPGAMWLVTNGTVNTGTQWRVSTTGAITVGSTALSIVQFNMPTVFTAGNGIAIASNAISVTPAASGGILVAAGGVSVDSSIVARKFSTTIGDGTTTSFVITHNLGTQDVILAVRQAANPYGVVDCDMSATSTTTATIAFATAPGAAAYRVTVIG